MNDFYAIVDHDDPTGNPTMEFRAEYMTGEIMTVVREMTMDEMLVLGAVLTTKALEIQAARRSTPGWEKRSYSVG